MNIIDWFRVSMQAVGITAAGVGVALSIVILRVLS